MSFELRERRGSLYLANRDGPPFVAQCETSKLRILLERFHTDRRGRLDESNDLLALLRKLWWLFGLTASLLIKIMKQ